MILLGILGRLSYHLEIFPFIPILISSTSFSGSKDMQLSCLILESFSCIFSENGVTIPTYSNFWDTPFTKTMLFHLLQQPSSECSSFSLVMFAFGFLGAINFWSTKTIPVVFQGHDRLEKFVSGNLGRKGKLKQVLSLPS